jgi:peptide/nickel transport system permease protein
VAAFAPLIATHDPLGRTSTSACCRRRGTHWSAPTTSAATSSRIVHGSRITLVVVVLVASSRRRSGLLGGTAAGYAGGWVDTALMRITDIFLAFPRLILALAFVAALGPGIENAVIAIASPPGRPMRASRGPRR